VRSSEWKRVSSAIFVRIILQFVSANVMKLMPPSVYPDELDDIVNILGLNCCSIYVKLQLLFGHVANPLELVNIERVSTYPAEKAWLIGRVLHSIYEVVID
jgi:hypothetical protein